MPGRGGSGRAGRGQDDVRRPRRPAGDETNQVMQLCQWGRLAALRAGFFSFTPCCFRTLVLSYPGQAPLE
jgi:hypothetical protein